MTQEQLKEAIQMASLYPESSVNNALLHQTEMLEKAVLGLESIDAKKGMTLLHNCCVEKYCTPVPGECGCTHQLGVSRGYDECASIAEDTLKEIRGGG